LVAGLALLFVRRRGNEDDDDEVYDSDDVFSDVELREQELDVQEDTDDSFEAPAPVVTAAATAAGTAKGYGEHRHDEYASDVEASDALAEADIYIAYGRHPQAIDLLNNALTSEPNNPVYRLKLIEIYTELGDRGAAAAQLEQLQALGDPQASAQGEAIFNNGGSLDNDLDSLGGDSAEPGLKPNPLQMDELSDAELEDEFTGLEIEETDEEGELDLSADFDDEEADEDDEELVIAADANGLSTKMDLARAYIDMGDEDGARQILEEVIAEGSDELRLEAETLLDRIGG
jgi:pilus assembly protein FimV